MKKNWKSKFCCLLTVCLVATICISVYFICNTIKSESVKKQNKSLFDSELSQLSQEDFHLDTSYVLFHSSTVLDYNGNSGVSYLGIVNKNGKLTEIFILDKCYNMISYNQENERLELYSRNETLYFGIDIFETKMISQELLHQNYIYSLTFDYPLVTISSTVDSSLIGDDEAYPYVGYRQTINMDGLDTLIPVGTAFTHTTLKYDK